MVPSKGGDSPRKTTASAGLILTRFNVKSKNSAWSQGWGSLNVAMSVVQFQSSIQGVSMFACRDTCILVSKHTVSSSLGGGIYGSFVSLWEGVSIPTCYVVKVC